MTNLPDQQETTRQAVPWCPVCRKLTRGSCRRRSCIDGQQRWAYDWWVVLGANGQRVDAARLVVITAPGQDVLPWERCGQAHHGACNGRRYGCRVNPGARDRWERGAYGPGGRWSRLHRTVLGRLRRMGFRSPLLGYVDEDQARGVVHRNLVLDEGPAAVIYQRELAQLAPAYGFGFVDRRPVVMPGQRVANYLAGYLVSGRKAERSVLSYVRRCRPGARVTYVATRLTTRSRVTMGTLRNGRRLYGSRRGWCSRPAGWAVVSWLVVDAETGEVLHPVWLERAPP